jgi:hypothetical protein
MRFIGATRDKEAAIRWTWWKILLNRAWRRGLWGAAAEAFADQWLDEACSLERAVRASQARGGAGSACSNPAKPAGQ